MNYPGNIKKNNIKKEPVNYANRGMNLESLINESNCYYDEQNKALINKKPTPIGISEAIYTNKGRVIKNGFFKAPSTLDYNGIYKGKYIDFEAKETKTLSFPFTNISLHQINHLDKVIHHGGIAFLIIAFTKVNEVYLLDASFMVEAYRKNDRKSLRYETIKEKGHLIRQGFLPRLHYLEIIDQYYCEVFK